MATVLTPGLLPCSLADDMSPTVWAIWLVQNQHAIKAGGWRVESVEAQQRMADAVASARSEFESLLPKDEGGVLVEAERARLAVEVRPIRRIRPLRVFRIDGEFMFSVLALVRPRHRWIRGSARSRSRRTDGFRICVRPSQ